MSSKCFGSTETVGSSTKRRSSDSYSSRCELAKNKRLSRVSVLDIQILRQTVVRELDLHNKALRSSLRNRETNPRMAASTCLRRFCKETSSGAPRTFKRFGASCYSGVPVFRRPGRSEPAIYRFSLLGGLREKKVFCPGNTLPRYCPGNSRIDYRPTKQIRTADNRSARSDRCNIYQGRPDGSRDQEGPGRGTRSYPVQLH